MNDILLFFLLAVKLALPYKHFVKDPVAEASFAFRATQQGGLLVTLDGSKSNDPDGYIVRYQWAQVGTSPNRAHITSPKAAITTVAPGHWVLGIYKFQLKVTDNQGASSTTIVTVTVVNGGQSSGL